jgi:hypothetical protein
VAEPRAPRRLKLTVSPLAKAGDKIAATVEGVNLPETVVRLEASDTVVVSQPHVRVVGPGSFNQTIIWTVEHVQAGRSSMVEITVTAGDAVQKGICKIVG